MVRSASPLAALPLIIASPAVAQERPAEVNLPTSRLDSAIRTLSLQTGTSIGFRDSRIATARVRPVRGRFTPAQALERMLQGTGFVARRVAPGSYLIEPAPRPAARRRVAPAPMPRPAPPPEQRENEEITVVVTASKRDVPLGAYPGGVQVIDGSTLTAADSLQGTGAIEARVASVASTHLGPGRNKLFIRGIADSSFVGPTQATVGQYWGNSRITYSAPDPNLKLYDVRSIEVLEGPQGTLYGAGSLGGVVRVVPRSPELNRFDGAAWGGATLIEHGQAGADGGAILNVPIVPDRLALRAVAFGSIEGGYIDDKGRGLRDVNRVGTIGGRAGLRFDAGDGWLFDLNGVGQRINGDDSQYAERGVGGLERFSSIAQPFSNSYWLAELVARKRWGDVELTSSLGFARQQVFERFEGPSLTDPGDPGTQPVSNAAPTAFSQSNRIGMLTVETRLARRGQDGTGWMIAASLLSNEAQVNRTMGVTASMRAPLTGVTNRVEEATLYGEVGVAPLPRLTLTFGARLTHARLSGSAEDAIEVIAYRIDPAARASRNETRMLPSVALAWRPNDDVTLFARHQQGFRPGGIAVRRDFVQRFDGDRVSTFEAGGRYTSVRFDLSASIAATSWSDIQADLVDGFGFPTTANAGDGRVLSIGFAARWRPIDGLEVDSALYLNDSKVTRRDVVILPVDPTLPFAVGDRLPNVAEATGRIGFSYSAELGDGRDVTASGFARYVGKSTLGIGSILGRLQGDYVDTGAEIRIGSGRRGFSLSVTNLLDAKGNRFALGSPFLIRDRDQTTPLRPRSVRLGFDLSF